MFKLALFALVAAAAAMTYARRNKSPPRNAA